MQNACGGGQERQELLTQDYTEQLCVFGEAQDGGLGSVTDSGLGRGE